MSFRSLEISSREVSQRRSTVLPRLSGPLGLLALLALAVVPALTGCQRGEKSCRYYSLVLEKSESPEDRKAALDAIKKLNTKDQQKCNDDRVFERLGKAMNEPKYRPLVIETVENVGRAGGKLRERSEKVLLAG